MSTKLFIVGVFLSIFFGLSARANAAFEFSGDPASGLDPAKVSLPEKQGTLLGLSGKASLSGNTGAMEWSYTLPLPQWRKVWDGLSLVYSSKNGNGTIGQGFALSLPSIGRMKNQGIPTASTPFQSSLDGELIAVSAGIYRPKYDKSFRRYRLLQSPSGPYWIMDDGKGKTYRFGSRPETLSRSTVTEVEWFLDSITTPAQQEIRFTWIRPNVEDAPVPGRISYIERSGVVSYVMLFSYENRRDAFQLFQQGFEQRYTKRLAGVTGFWIGERQLRDEDLSASFISDPRERIFRIQLQYQELGQTGRSLLSRIDRFGKQDSDQTPAQLLSWSPEASSFTIRPYNWNLPFTSGLVPNLAKWIDINGDGLPDLVGQRDNVWAVSLNRGAGEGFAPPQLLDNQRLNFSASVLHNLIDVNGDRAVDFLYRQQVYLTEAERGQFTSEPRSIGGIPTEQVASANVNWVDLNADSKAELVITGATTLQVYRNRSTPEGIDFEPPVILRDANRPGVYGQVNPSVVKWGDLNGDGLPDAYAVLPATKRVLVSYNQGHLKFSPVRTLPLEGSPYNPAPFLADLNGDGVNDFVFGFNNVSALRAFLFQNNRYREVVIQVPEALRIGMTMIESGDLNGNGSKDLFFVYNNGRVSLVDSYADAKTKAPFLLEGVRSELGDTSQFVYESSLMTNKTPGMRSLPITFQVLRELQTVAPRLTETGKVQKGLVSARRYGFEDGVFDFLRNEFLGFRLVVEQTAAELDAQGVADFATGTVKDTRYYTDEQGGALRNQVREETLREAGSLKVLQNRVFERGAYRPKSSVDFNIVFDRTQTQIDYEADGSSRLSKTSRCTKLYQDNWTLAEDSWLEWGNQNQVYRSIVNVYYPQLGGSWYVNQLRTQELFSGEPESRSRPIVSRAYVWNQDVCALAKVLRGDGDSFRVQRSFTYDEHGNVAMVHNAYGDRTDIFYEQTGQFTPSRVLENPLFPRSMALEKAYVFDLVDGSLIESIDQNQQSTRYVYDGLKRLTNVKVPGSDLGEYRFDYTWGSDTSLSVVKSYQSDVELPSAVYYDGIQRKVLSARPTGNGQFVLDGLQVFNLKGDVVTESLSQQASSLDQSTFDFDPRRFTKLAYDARSRPIRKIQPDIERSRAYYSADGLEVPKGTAVWAYSAYVQKSWNAEGEPREDETDAFGRVIRVTEINSSRGFAEPSHLRLVYDVANRVQTLRKSDLPERTYLYDERQRLQEIRSPEWGRIVYLYNEEDRPLAETYFDTKGRVLSSELYSYDALQREIERRILRSEVKNYDEDFARASLLYRFTHDRGDGSNLKGRVATLEMEDGSSIAYSYDPQGQTIREAYRSAQTAFAMNYRFDAFGRLKEITYPRGEVYSYGYSRISGEMTGMSGVADNILYDAYGRMSDILLSSGLKQSMTYDFFNEAIASVEWGQQGKVLLAENTKEFDHLGRLLSHSTLDPRGGKTDKSFVYDLRGQLTRADYHYEAASGAKQRSLAEFSYAANGEFTRFAGRERTYIRDAQGQLEQIAEGTRVRASFDDFGRMVGTDASELLWLDARRLEKIRTIKGGVESESTFSYMPDNRRLKERSVTNGVVQTKIYLNKYTICNLEKQTFIYDLYLGSQRVARKAEGTSGMHFILSDRLGSFRANVNARGELVAYKDYDPFGQTLTWGDAEPKGQTYAFTGMHVDEASGLQQHQNRFYVPTLGVFASLDPYFTKNPEKCVASPVECNLYSYALNDPLQYVDPNGKQGHSLDMISAELPSLERELTGVATAYWKVFVELPARIAIELSPAPAVSIVATGKADVLQESIKSDYVFGNEEFSLGKLKDATFVDYLSDLGGLAVGPVKSVIKAADIQTSLRFLDSNISYQAYDSASKFFRIANSATKVAEAADNLNTCRDVVQGTLEVGESIVQPTDGDTNETGKK